MYRAAKRAVDAGVFRGVAFHEKKLPATFPLLSEHDKQLSMAYDSLGTDFAINFARTRFCNRLPIKREMLSEVVAYLNQRNRSYRRKDYHWHMLENNCSHTAGNAVAIATGALRFRKIDQVLFKRLLHLAIPGNIIIDMIRHTNGGFPGLQPGLWRETPSPHL